MIRFDCVTKRFISGFQALDEVSFEIMASEMVFLTGHSGAGKSTLVKCVAGFQQAEQGSIMIDGREQAIDNPVVARALGVGMVYQHFTLAPGMTVAENLLLAGGKTPALIHWKRKRAELAEFLAGTPFRLDLNARPSELAAGEKQKLELLKQLYLRPRLLILDEPTAVLTPQETEQLFGVLMLLRSQGTTIVLITHKLKEVMRLCDDVTVMRGGRVVARVAIADTSADQLAEAMVGRKVAIGRAVGAAQVPGDVKLQASNISLKDAQGVLRLSGIDLQLRAGEIVGIAGVSGNGQSELLEVLSGLRRPTSGQLSVATRTFGPDTWLHPTLARELKIAHVPEDRHARAMVMDFDAWESAVLGYEALPCYSRWGWMLGGRMRAATRKMMEQFDVRPRNAQLQSSKFSGGNQQKLVLARELGQAPHVLLVGQPTRGVDIGAIEFIYSQLRALRAQGCAVLVLSSELDEILALSDRVVVMCQGRITGELPIDACSENRLGVLMTGGA